MATATAARFPDKLPVLELQELGADYNPRTISDQKLRALRKSLRKYGHVQNVVVNKRTARKGWPRKARPVIVGGHQTTKAAVLEKIDELAVRWVDLDKFDEQELNLALNAIDGDWDQKLLGPLLAGLKSAEPERGDLEATGFTDGEIGKILAAELAENGKPTPEEINELTTFGGATAMHRSSAPWKFWTKSSLLVGDVLDFGCGHEDHGVERYDAFTFADNSKLLRSWDTITANYVLNTQPADHLVVQILALLSRMLRPDGRVLVACITNSKTLDGTRAAGGRETKSRAEWEELLEQIFDFERVKATAFLGWILTAKP